MNSLRVLLIEDDFADAELAKIYLEDIERIKISVHHSANFYDGVAALSENEFDLILMDMRLPDVDQPEGLKILLKKYSSIPLIVITGFEDEQSGFEAIRLGAQDLLMKDHYDSQTLYRSINYSIERFRLKKQFRRNEKIARDLIEIGELYTWTLNLGNTMMQWSAETIEAFNLGEFDRSDLENFYKRIHQDDLSEFKEIWAKAVSNEQVFRVKHRMEKVAYFNAYFLTKIRYDREEGIIKGVTSRL